MLLEVLCIICKKEKKDFSEEHVFPGAIGGNLTLDRVCETCNGFLGHSVDSHLVNHLLIQQKRQMLKIPGRKGNIPNPLERGTLASDSSQKIRYQFDKQGNPEKLYLIPNINGESITIDIQDRDKLPSIINKILKRKGLAELSEDKIWAMAKEGSYSLPEISVAHSVDMIQYKRSILKIAYELCFYWLGEKYLEDTQGEEIRRSLLDESDKSEWVKKYGIQGSINLKGLSPIPNFWDNEPNSHVSCILAVGNAIVCLIKIFDVFEGVIEVSKDREKYRGFEPKFISIDAKTGRIRESTFDEELSRILANPNSG